MVDFGFHASHEQIPPSALLRHVRTAEQAGFTRAMCSDHFAPWTSLQGQSGFAWSWLGAALASTSLPFGVVTAPGQRYHPAIHAQMSATLAEMFPGRFWFAAGSGQALNEHVTGDRWPSKAEREERLLECIEVIRALHAGETVSHEGRVRVDRAVLWTRPAMSPPIFGAAVTPRTAAWVATWADGLITINQPPDTLREVLEAFRAAGGSGPVRLQVHVAHAENEAASLELAHRQWAPVMIGSELAWNIATPAEFEQVARFVRPDDVREAVLVGGGAGSLVEQVAALLDVGAGYGLDELYLHHVGQEQDAWLDAAGSTVLPTLRAHAG